ncbi:MAG: hypothetical protein KQA31_00530 [Candidatus Aenigmarchaeota archaeon]|nr:hypothetical protein [Candidatus Aenigmarchaeota archaeon]
MLYEDIIVFIISFFVLIKSSDYAMKYSHKIGLELKLPDFIISFFIVAFISVLPELSISIISAINKQPQFGLGTLLGATVADLTLVFGIVSLFSNNGIKIRSNIIMKNLPYLFLLILPFILGHDGNFTRMEGFMLVFSGILFYFAIFIQSNFFRNRDRIKNKNILKHTVFLIISLTFLLLSSKYVVNFGLRIAKKINVPTEIISLTIVSVGVCLPELLFSIKSVKEKFESLAIGDIFGIVIIDSTITLGIISLITPFEFNPIIIYIAGTAIIVASIILILFFKTDRTLSKTEGIFLILFYIIYIIIQFFGNKIL